jgi:hypothetical protein
VHYEEVTRMTTVKKEVPKRWWQWFRSTKFVLERVPKTETEKVEEEVTVYETDIKKIEVSKVEMQADCGSFSPNEH